MSIESTLTGAAGASSGSSVPFQVAGCSGLPFAPKLTASVAGKGSRTDGTTFTVRLESQGLGQADPRKVDLQLPAVLPSRLTTLQKACTEATFNANPAGCSPESVIGTATIHTPVLRSPLTGPAYLVSHGGASFPDVEFVLQGEGIEIVLDGKTDIKNGITYSRFESAPDAPFTVFETVLPAGPKSVLAAYAKGSEPEDLCNETLQVPTEMTAQDGVKLTQDTVISKTGCSGVKSYTSKLTRAQRLKKALASCRKRYKHKHAKRVSCEKKARKTYGPKKHKKTKKAKGKAKRSAKSGRG
jgi:hypothetical protein